LRAKWVGDVLLFAPRQLSVHIEPGGQANLFGERPHIVFAGIGCFLNLNMSRFCVAADLLGRKHLGDRALLRVPWS